MRNLEEIERELAETREELENAEGSPAEVYSRIVGYYRSVRNWNKGKREEYGERKLFSPESFAKGSVTHCTAKAVKAPKAAQHDDADGVLLFVRPTCPACPSAKEAALALGNKTGIPVQTVDAGTEAGLAEAQRFNVLSTPTAILLSHGKELSRARDSKGIAGWTTLLKKAA